MSKSNSKKVNKAIMWALMAVTAITMAGCNANNNSGDNTDTGTGTGNSIMSNSDEEKSYDEFTVAYSDTYGAWELNNDIVYHSPSTQTRYTIYADADGGIVGTDGNKYSIKERDYKLYDILNLSDDTLVLKEGIFEQERVGSLDYPDGYKRCVFSYKRCNLFNTDDIESCISAGEVSTGDGDAVGIESSSEGVTTESTTTEVTTEATTVEVSEATTVEQTTVATTVEQTTTVATTAEQTTSSPANVDTASIEKDINDFMKTDNFVQKDAGNRALELFNHLHNVSDSNIDMNSIENDTANKIVRFNYGDNCVIEVNVEDAVVNVK